jgi:hypothetical protein
VCAALIQLLELGDLGANFVFAPVEFSGVVESSFSVLYRTENCVRVVISSSFDLRIIAMIRKMMMMIMMMMTMMIVMDDDDDDEEDEKEMEEEDEDDERKSQTKCRRMCGNDDRMNGKADDKDKMMAAQDMGGFNIIVRPLPF